jgi:hypothetical protein
LSRHSAVDVGPNTNRLLREETLPEEGKIHD